MTRHLQRFLALCLALCLWPLAAEAKRMALVMGNDNYQHVAPLQKAGNDAAAMAAELRSAGFDVVLHRDLNYRAMVKAMETLYNSVTGGDEVVVFFAGHGVQIKSGSYLLPIDIEATSESEVEKTSYALNDLMEHLGQAKAAFSLVLVDACRDNPLRSRGRNLGMGRGLNPPDPPKGQMVVYSASRGQQALDRLHDRDTNPNGVFTREFISRMRRPGLRVEELVREVQDSVERLARTVSHEQRPALYNEARGNFYFYQPVVAAASSSGGGGNAAIDEARREDRFWEDAKAAGNREGFEAYLDQYRNGRYASLARANLNRLAAAAPASTTAASNSTLQARPAVAVPVAATTAPADAAILKASPPPAAAPAPAAAATTPVVVAALDSRQKVRTRVNLPNGDRYEGEVIGVIRTGTGVYSFANGDRYEGEFADNTFHGKGTQTFASGDVYSGDFVRGVKIGQGVYSFANGDRYEGAFVDNQFHGKGKQTYKSGDSFEGEFVQGNKQGPGVYRFANGDRFEGNFADNLFNGRGKMNFANGDRYEGDFRNSAKDGQGIHYFANQERYEGSFQAGMQSGAGTHFYANGDKYTGQFANGVRHGKGVYTFSNGQTREMEFAGGAEKSN
jgi:hypothetical protein